MLQGSDDSKSDSQELVCARCGKIFVHEKAYKKHSEKCKPQKVENRRKTFFKDCSEFDVMKYEFV